MNILELLKPFNGLMAFTADAPKAIPTPPVVAPPPVEEATLETVATDEETKKATTLGTKSLQIPLGTIGGDSPLNI